MRMYDVIEKKRNGKELSDQEISWMVDNYVAGDIPDYQMSAMLMAIYFQGMTDREIGVMTDCMARSGDMVDLSSIEGIKVDKHSTGGVGDKTTLIVAPIAAACGVKVAKMSGRGLGHTGGTVDKLESIPGFRIALSREEFFDTVNRIGVSVVGQSGNMAPADKKIYALRDVTATVESIPLIAASIMSKKLAAGSDCIVLDVKTGSGAFMKTLEDSISLAKKMTAIGAHAGKRTVALITGMDIPLGQNIGNTLEVKESVEVLMGRGPEDLRLVSLELAANMLYLADKGTLEECMKLAKQAIEDGSALKRLAEMVQAQGGDSQVIYDPEKFPKSTFEFKLKAENSGYITHMDTEEIGLASVMLGAGRETVESKIDYTAGIMLHKKTGDFVKTGDILAEFYASQEALFAPAVQRYKAALTFGSIKPSEEPFIYARVEHGKPVVRMGKKTESAV